MAPHPRLARVGLTPAPFGAAADAVGAATDIQRAIERANRRVDDARRLAVRVGLVAAATEARILLA